MNIRSVVALSAAWLGLGLPAFAGQDAATTVHAAAPRVDPAASLDWPLHMQDLASSRYSPATEFTADNAATLELKWTFTPTIVAGGVRPAGRSGRLERPPEPQQLLSADAPRRRRRDVRALGVAAVRGRRVNRHAGLELRDAAVRR